MASTEKELSFDGSIKCIRGGFNGMVRILADYCYLIKTDGLKKQLLIRDDFSFKLDDIDPFQMQSFVESICLSYLGDPNMELSLFRGKIDMFAKGTPMEKCLRFIDESDLEDHDKKDIKSILLKDSFEDSAISKFLDIYDDFLGDVMFHVRYYMADFSIEKEYRQKKLIKLLEKLETAIVENKELDKNAPRHLTEYIGIMNPKFLELKKALTEEFKEYLPSAEQYVDLGYSKQTLLSELIDGQNNLDAFYKYERKLIERGFLNKESNQWLKSPKLLIRLYCYCENKQMFKHKHYGKSSGVKKLREIYNFKDGASLDYPNKRKKEKGLLVDYFFLDN